MRWNCSQSLRIRCSPTTLRQTTIGDTIPCSSSIKSKYGTPQEFKEFVKQCHQRQIAVIVDVVYNHLVDNSLLKEFGGFTTSEIPGGIFLYGGDRANTGFGPRPDYGRLQVRQYINDNALLLLRDYGVDGLR